MDNTTISKYGWIIVVVIVCIAMITMAPFMGDHISSSLITNVMHVDNNFTGTLDPQGGSIQYTEILVAPGRQYVYLPTPTKDGMTVLGWYSDSSGGQRITEHTIFQGTSDFTLYARWQSSN